MLPDSEGNSHLALLLRAQGWVGGGDNLPKAGGLGVAAVIHGMHVDRNNTRVAVGERLVSGVGAQKGARSATAPDAIHLGLR